MDQPAERKVTAPEPTRVPAGALRPQHGQGAGCRPAGPTGTDQDALRTSGA